MASLTLASQSPRRAELLRQLGVSFRTQPAAIDEARAGKEDPLEYVQRMAREKAEAVAASLAINGPENHTSINSVSEPLGHCVLGADTTVILAGECLGKPVDRQDARRMLQRLSNATHSVASAVCVLDDQRCSLCCVSTDVSFCELNDAQVEAYLDSDEPWDKAGSYGIQGLAGAFVRSISGSYSNVVGLPLAETRELLQTHGVPTALDGTPAL